MTFEKFHKRLLKQSETLPDDVRDSLSRLYTMPNVMTYMRGYYTDLGIMKPFFKEAVLNMVETFRNTNSERSCESGTRLCGMLEKLRMKQHHPNPDFRRWAASAEEICSDKKVLKFLEDALNNLNEPIVANAINMAIAWTECECVKDGP